MRGRLPTLGNDAVPKSSATTLLKVSGGSLGLVSEECVHDGGVEVDVGEGV